MKLEKIIIYNNNFILHILFSEIDDYSTNDVLDWFIKLGQKYIRYNGKTTIYQEFNFRKISINFNFGSQYDDSEIVFKNSNLLKNVSSIWFRRPYNGVRDIFDKFHNNNTDLLNEKVNSFLRFHNKTLKDFTINSIINKCNVVLGSYSTTSLNKPEVLLLAKSFGINIPNTIISNDYNKTLNPQDSY